MSPLNVIDRDEAPPRAPQATSTRSQVLFLAAAVAAGAAGLVSWWWSTEDTRTIRELPDAQRIPLYHRTMDNLKNVCDPAAPRSLRDFCHEEAALVLRFRECDSDPRCQELARRHLPQPHR